MTTVNYNDGKWHGHNGGECPVHPETVVDLTVWVDAYGSGSGLDGHSSIKAGSISWSHVNAFRVTKEHKEPREFWVYRSSIFNTFDSALTFAHGKTGEIIHVREVTP